MASEARAIRYVRRQGSAVEVSRMATVLWNEDVPENVLEDLKAAQRPDGGFSHWVKGVSNVCDTAYVLQWLDDLHAYEHPVSKAACRFLLERQKPDGGWNEIEAVGVLEPPEWLIPGRVETRTWLTGSCAHMLIRFGFAEAPGTTCPTDFLLRHADEEGRLAGYFRATWLALPMLAFYPGRESEPFRRALRAVEAGFSGSWGAGYLGWLLRCLSDAGVPESHSVVTRSLDVLESLQHEDGHWDPEEGEGPEHAVDATVTSLRALKEYGRIR